MTTRSARHDTFVIERRLAQPPERVFDAFADPAKKARWFGCDGNAQGSCRAGYVCQAIGNARGCVPVVP